MRQCSARLVCQWPLSQWRLVHERHRHIHVCVCTGLQRGHVRRWLVSIELILLGIIRNNCNADCLPWIYATTLLSAMMRLLCAVANNCAGKCLNGATCVNSANSFSCVCIIGYTGATCQSCKYKLQSLQFRLVPCYCLSCSYINFKSITSLHETIMIVQDSIYKWMCLHNEVAHDTCTVIDNCVSLPCTNGATCVNSLNMYTCVCVPGSTGNIC